MIAVSANSSDKRVVEEFFELFKTPWEFYRKENDPEVLICSGSAVPDNSAKLLVVYGSVDDFDRKSGIRISSRRTGAILSYRQDRLPVYGSCLAFDASGAEVLMDETTAEAVGFRMTSGTQVIVRLGYNLFSEIRFLLTHGQPSAHAGMPALETHICMLRNLITGSSIPLIEIPPVPAGYKFMACLTHDVDHVGIQNHKFDHTLFGFLYRAIGGSVIDLVKGRKSLGQLATNFWAVLCLPFVHLGLARDYWYQFENYLKIENGLPSTFFFIPKKGEPGQDSAGCRPAKRAAKYDVNDLADELKHLLSAGNEIGVHGIDAWRDPAKGREEMERISSLTGQSELGVRMHWLFFDQQSPVALEAAGFTYDSTIGYNDTIGYRAGTTQAFKPLQVEYLLELPMHVMDTALFYPSYLHLSPKQAGVLVDGLIRNAMRFGGVLTVNWHDRSIAPERLWGNFYIKLIEDLKNSGAWFSTATQAVSWFRMRRSARIEDVTVENGNIIGFKTSGDMDLSLPGLSVRVYKPKQPTPQGSLLDQPTDAEFVDLPFECEKDLGVAV